MNFRLSDDQKALVDAIEKRVLNLATTPNTRPDRFEFPSTLQMQINDGDFFSAILINELGPVASVAMVMEMCKLPACLEVATSAFIAPYVCPDVTGPFVVTFDRLKRPLRFAPVASTVIRIEDDSIAWARLQTDDTEPTDSLFAYPIGSLSNPERLEWNESLDTDVEHLRRMWRLGVAAEIVGCLAAALTSVVEHVSDRRQFGQPIGSFQAIQHRLAECATLIESARWLTFKAASTGTTLDCLMALGFAQDIVTRVSYDLHQFTGAMGLTLEHPLHRWTYRVKLLRAEMGGCTSNFTQLADHVWTDNHTVSP